MFSTSTPNSISRGHQGVDPPATVQDHVPAVAVDRVEQGAVARGEELARRCLGLTKTPCWVPQSSVRNSPSIAVAESPVQLVELRELELEDHVQHAARPAPARR